VLVDPALNHLIGSNQLVPYGISVAGGYSSLEASRYLDYWWGMVRDENVLLDLFNVRYMVIPRQQSGSLMFNETRFHHAERIVNGSRFNPAGEESLRAPSLQADRVTVISAVDGMENPESGEPVAEIVLIGPHGEQRYVLRYGIELTGYNQGAPNPSAANWAYFGPSFNPLGRSSPIQLSGTTLTVDPPLQVDRVDVRYVGSSGIFLLHGLGLRDAESFATSSLTSADRVKFQPVYQDDDVTILENHAATSKVYFRAGATTVRADPPLAQDMEAGPLDLHREIAIDRENGALAHAAPADARGQAALLRYGAADLLASVNSNAGGFLVVGDRFDPGWRAWVDGNEAPVLRANSVMRAVPVGVGEHVVEMRYEPWWIQLGLMISLITLSCVVFTLLILTRPPRRQASVSTASP
jgi:hypothetical protein